MQNRKAFLQRALAVVLAAQVLVFSPAPALAHGKKGGNKDGKKRPLVVKILPAVKTHDKK